MRNAKRGDIRVVYAIIAINLYVKCALMSDMRQSL